MIGWGHRSGVVFLSVLALLACLSVAMLRPPAGAEAATVVNGDFETGTLAGWHSRDNPFPPGSSGSWFAYTGTAPPLNKAVPLPPHAAGNFAAITDGDNPGTRIIYQDIALEPNHSHLLSMLVYYETGTPLATPTPNTLDYSGLNNLQYRVDVINPAAAVESVNPSDILATAFATKPGDPQDLAPTIVTADLSSLAGRTVRLRLAEVDYSRFRAGADSISIQSTPPPQGDPPSNAIVLGKLELRKRNGTAKLPVTVPGAGVLGAVDANFGPGPVTKKRVKRLVKSASVTTTAAGTIKVPFKPTKAALARLEENGKIKVRVNVTFTPTGGTAATTTVKAMLRLKKR